MDRGTTLSLRAASGGDANSLEQLLEEQDGDSNRLSRLRHSIVFTCIVLLILVLAAQSLFFAA